MLAEDNTPMIFRGKDIVDIHEDRFYPICQAYFAANEYGVKLFCKKLGYQTGNITSLHLDLKDKAVLIGECSSHDSDLRNCTGSMQMGLGFYKDYSDHCVKGKKSGMKVVCFGGNGKTHNCGGKLERSLSCKENRR